MKKDAMKGKNDNNKSYFVRPHLILYVMNTLEWKGTVVLKSSQQSANESEQLWCGLTNIEIAQDVSIAIQR